MDGFRQFLFNNDRSNFTIYRHINILKRLFKECPEFSFDEVEAFLLRLKLDNRKNRYLNSLVSTIRLYAQYLELDKRLQKHRYYKDNPVIKATMSDGEIEAFLSLPRPYHASSTTWQTYTVFFTICAYTGLRPGECSQLLVSDVDFGLNVFHIRNSKSAAGVGMVPIPANIQGLIKHFIEDLSGESLFPSRLGGNKDGRGQFVDNVDWHYNFHKRIKLLGIKRLGLTPYSLRHSYATALLANGVDIHTTKRLMRHSDIKMTEVYAHLNVEDLRRAQAKLPQIRRNTEPSNILAAMSELIKSFHIEQDNRFKFQLAEDQDSVKFECRIAQETRK